MLTKIRTILAATENRQTFFARIERHYSRYSKEYKFIERAYDDAKDAFRNIKRQGGDRYFEHLRAVAIILIDSLHIFELVDLRIPAYKVLAAALLHDTVEDCEDLDIETIYKEFGDNIGFIVDAVTKTNNYYYLEPDKIFKDKVEKLLYG